MKKNTTERILFLVTIFGPLLSSKLSFNPYFTYPAVLNGQFLAKKFIVTRRSCRSAVVNIHIVLGLFPHALISVNVVTVSRGRWQWSKWFFFFSRWKRRKQPPRPKNSPLFRKVLTQRSRFHRILQKGRHILLRCRNLLWIRMSPSLGPAQRKLYSNISQCWEPALFDTKPLKPQHFGNCKISIYKKFKISYQEAEIDFIGSSTSFWLLTRIRTGIFDENQWGLAEVNSLSHGFIDGQTSRIRRGLQSQSTVRNRTTSLRIKGGSSKVLWILSTYHL